MVKVACSICGYYFDKEHITLCPDCDGHICEECSFMYRGHCKNCSQETTLDFEQ